MAQYQIKIASDLRMVSNVADTNFSSGNQDLTAGKSATGTQRSLIPIDFSKIPGGSVITAAELHIYNRDNSAATADGTLRLYRAIRAWTSGATWNKYDGTNAWGTAGAANTSTDREAADSGSVAITSGQAIAYLTIPLTAANIQAMFSGAFVNNGFVLKTDEASFDLHSFDDTGNTNFPYFVIAYTTDDCAYFV